MTTNSNPDPSALIAARYAVRDAWRSIRQLQRVDPLPDTLDRLDQLCAELTAEIEAIEPMLPGLGMAIAVRELTT